jgi:hypothetical protein
MRAVFSLSLLSLRLSQRFVASLCRFALTEKKIEMVFFLLWKADYKWL